MDWRKLSPLAVLGALALGGGCSSPDAGDSSGIGGTGVGGAGASGGTAGSTSVGGANVGGSAVGGSAVGGSAMGGSAMGGSAAGGTGNAGNIGGMGLGGSDPGCTAPLSDCGGTCVDLLTDGDHCGDCGMPCDPGSGCENGSCVPACDAAELLCGGACIDPTTDASNCGACDVGCSLHEQCQASTCDCTDNAELCADETCHDPSYERAHCGGCDSPCDPEEACNDGDCVTIGIPAEAYCDPTTSWTSEWTILELEILDIVNQRRAEGATCGARGYQPPVGPLRMDASLRCAARMHSMDMVERAFFDHDNPDGDGPGPRMDAAGYGGGTWGENIAGGNGSAEATMEQWMESDGHCVNIMNEDFNLIGVGYYPGGEYRHYWTQTFGAD